MATSMKAEDCSKDKLLLITDGKKAHDRHFLESQKM